MRTVSNRLASAPPPHWAWAGAALWLLGLVVGITIDGSRADGTPTTLGHMLASYSVVMVAAFVWAAAGARGLTSASPRTSAGAAAAILVLGGVSLLAFCVIDSVVEAAGPNQHDHAGLFLVGTFAGFSGTGWLAVLRRRVGADEPGAAGRWPAAWLAVFLLLDGLCAFGWATREKTFDRAALWLAAAMGIVWAAARLLGLGRRLQTAPAVGPGTTAAAWNGGAGEGKISRSWRLTRVAWTTVRSDRTLIALTVVSAVVGLALAAVWFWLADFSPDGKTHSTGRWLWVSAVLIWPSTFVTTYLNVAVAAAAAAAIDGRHLTGSEALAVSHSRLKQIIVWSLLSAGVGLVLQEIASRLPWGGRVATWLVGVAWGLATFFAIPILALEGCTATGCVRRSTRLIQERWGEGISGTVSISGWSVIVAMPAGAAVGVAFALHGPARVVLLVLAAAMLITVSTIAGAVRQVFGVVLYRYAVDGHPSGGYTAGDLEHPFRGSRH